ncbi:MAG: hypothetical protein ABSA57_15355 [Candidatus Acidiferrales bacterium]|jgi:hypothetical protein
MNIAPAHLDALQALGYSEQEARFLYIVATHSGYFVARQFSGFADAHGTKRTTLFWSKLERLRHVRRDCFPKSGVIYHLFSGRLYRQIDRENIRNRRAHEIDFIKRRIAVLDFVLLNSEYQYLETEPEKVRFFCETLNIRRHFLPARLYLGKNGSRAAIRHFVDKFPMLLAPPSVVTFTYVGEGAVAFTDFIRHLEAYLPLFRQLSEFGLIYLSRSNAHFGRATQIFHSLVKIPLESDIAGDLLRYFQVRKAWDDKQYAALSDSDLIFRNQASARFNGERFEGLYRGWKNGRVTESSIQQTFPTDNRKRIVHFESRLLGRIAPPATDSVKIG